MQRIISLLLTANYDTKNWFERAKVWKNELGKGIRYYVLRLCISICACERTTFLNPLIALVYPPPISMLVKHFCEDSIKIDLHNDGCTVLIPE